MDWDAHITVIVCWHGGKLHTFVEHENLDDFLDLLDEVKLLASFNGSSFDVPRILASFHIPELPCPHLDLRWPFYHRGLIGSLKDIAREAGVSRPVDLADADGMLAVQLWDCWAMQQNRAARDQLLRYCAADVLMLVELARQFAGHSPTTSVELWKHLPPVVVSGADEADQSDDMKSLISDFGSRSPSKLRALRVRVAG